jgi:hypothetical protein
MELNIFNRSVRDVDEHLSVDHLDRGFAIDQRAELTVSGANLVSVIETGGLLFSVADNHVDGILVILRKRVLGSHGERTHWGYYLLLSFDSNAALVERELDR